MTRTDPSSRPPTGVVLVMRWLVLLVIMVGTITSSIGGMSSHGLADLSTALHATPGEPHGHPHEDQGGELVMVDQTAAADHHHHHGADHSHDKAHALPMAWNSATPQLPGWFGWVRQWTEMVQTYRLERPPMG